MENLQQFGPEASETTFRGASLVCYLPSHPSSCAYWVGPCRALQTGEVIDGKVSSYAACPVRQEVSLVVRAVKLEVVAYVEAIYMLTGALDGPTGDGAREGHFGACLGGYSFSCSHSPASTLQIAGSS